MADLSQKARNSVELQRELFRLAEAEHGLSIAVLSRTRKIPISTLKGWREGSAMPAWALGELELPDDLASLVLTGYRRAVITITDDGEQAEDFDNLGLEALGLAGEIQQARTENSPGGTNIIHIEKEAIRKRARRVSGQARAVAA
jgi:hypothetical protein